MSIRVKLTINTLLAIIFLAMIGATGFFFTNNVANVSLTLFETQAIPILKINDIEKTTQAILLQFITHISTQDPETMTQIENRIKELHAQLQEEIKEYEKVAGTETKQGSSETNTNRLNSFQGDWLQFNEVGQTIVSLSSEYSKEEAFSLVLSEGKDHYDQALNSLKTQIQFHHQQMMTLRDDAVSTEEQSSRIILLLTPLVALVLGLLSFFLIRQISKDLGVAIHITQQVSEGNLNVTFPKLAKDEIGKLLSAMEHMVESLDDILTQVALASEQLTKQSQQISKSSQIIAQGSSQQANFLGNISSSMKRMNDQTDQNAENATQTNRLAVSAREKAEGGNEQMQHMLTAMNQINNASEDISKIIKTIDEIAFQTNLLALNAAVEAARAGTHGKGFAVVADEVRDLAQRSAKAATETTTIIEDSIQKVQTGVEIANNNASSLTEIVRGSTKVTDLVNEIAHSSNEQTKVVDEINQELTQLHQITQQNSQTSGETAAASEELAGQAETLKHLVNRFKLQQEPTRQADIDVTALGVPNSVPEESSSQVPMIAHSG